MLFICYPKCGTCRKARKYLEEHGIPFQERLIHEEPPTVKELRTWQKKSGLPLRKFFNTSGKLYKELNLKDRLKTMSEDEMFELLASDGMLVKRPILTDQEKVLVGFDEAAYSTLK
ncbi:MAG: arsenate reductase family protein [Solobacterium sp.]|nr:arsenate reductase family protein [Solobacterium sp.]